MPMSVIQEIGWINYFCFKKSVLLRIIVTLSKNYKKIIAPHIKTLLLNLSLTDEELIRWGWPEDVWFHVHNYSSAHVYLRLQEVYFLLWKLFSFFKCGKNYFILCIYEINNNYYLQIVIYKNNKIGIISSLSMLNSYIILIISVCKVSKRNQIITNSRYIHINIKFRWVLIQIKHKRHTWSSCLQL